MVKVGEVGVFSAAIIIQTTKFRHSDQICTYDSDDNIQYRYTLFCKILSRRSAITEMCLICFLQLYKP